VYHSDTRCRTSLEVGEKKRGGNLLIAKSKRGGRSAREEEREKDLVLEKCERQAHRRIYPLEREKKKKKKGGGERDGGANKGDGCALWAN